MSYSLFSLKGNKPVIDMRVSFCELFDFHCVNSIKDQFRNADNVIKRLEPSVNQGALNNVHGAWYEKILATKMWNYFHEDRSTRLLAVPLPNVTSFDVAELFDEKLRDYIHDLRSKVLNISKVEFVTSNPDFVLFRPDEQIFDAVSSYPPVSAYSDATMDMLDKMYLHLVHKANFKTLAGFISTKTSFRPDRRLQIPHEGSLMKALYAHLVTREWEINPPGIKYFAVACEVKESDRKALKTVATHSITTVTEMPKAAVDDVFQVDSIIELAVFLKDALAN